MSAEWIESSLLIIPMEMSEQGMRDAKAPIIRADWRHALSRKVFHLFSLAYLVAYCGMGFPRSLYAFGVWLAFVFALETGRLHWEPFNRGIGRLFSGIIRETEHRAYSGVFYTAVGAFLVVLLAGRHPRVVTAALLGLALGDAAAALAGKAFGRHRVLGGAKSLEGSLACLCVCLGSALAAGLPLSAAVAGALAATLAELLPTTGICNDNLWMPVASVVAILALGGR